MPNDAGNSLATATRLALSSTAVLREDLAEPGVSDFYQVNLAYRSSVSVAISGFSGDVDLRILDRNGNLVTVSGTPLESSNPENFAESITTTLNPGLYFIEVSGTSLTEATEYTLTAVRNSGIPGDILWRQTVTGETVAWDMEGTQRQAVVPVTPAQPAPSPGGGIWQVQATGDLNNDGNVDLLWRNSTTGENRLWLMNGANLVQEIPLLNVAPTSATSNWRMQGVGDFNQDGRADILWRNYVTGENIVWYMNGGERLGVESLVNTGTPTQWEIQGVGDFNQDGQPDILWRNQVTGENRLWLMEQLAAAQNLVLLQVVNLNWRIQGVGDFTGDGQPDILWRNFQTGDNVVWEMNGADRVSVQPLLPVTTTAWRAYAPYNLGLTTPSPADTIGNSLATAFNVGSNLSAVGEFAGFAGATDQNDYYRFSIDQLSRIRIDLAGLAGNLDLELLSSGGTVIQSSAQPGNVAESIIRDLAPGQYFLRVFSTGENSNYNLVFDINNFPVLAVNTPLAVDEGALGTISSTVLQVTDTEDSASELTYTVTTLPSNGTLLLNGFSLNGVNSFTQADLDNGLLTYQHDGSETLTDSFTFTVADSGGASFNNVFTFAINPVNDPPGLSVNQGLTVNEGQSSNLQALISVTDNDNPATELTYSIVDAPVNGVLSLGGAPLGDRSFTQADVDLGRVLYRHNGSETLSDRFTFTVVDLGGASLPITTFNIQVNPVNDPPRVGLNAGLVVDEGASGNLQGVLQITDDDNGDDQLTFTLEATPINGILLLDGSTELTAGSTFTQDDINNSRLTYRHNGSEIPFDSFTFVVRDPLGATLPTTAFQITVNPVNDSPELTVPPTQAVDQNASTGIPGISIADPDADPGSITVTLQVQNGNLSLGSAAGLDFFSGNNTRQLLLTGTLTAVNNALNTLLYISDAAFRGTDTVVVNVNDNGNTGLGGEKTDTASFSLNVAPVNQPPAIALPVTPPQVREDEVTGISGISITDPDAAGGAITVALIASNGTLSLSSNPGVIFVGDSSGRTLVFSGSLGVVNTALNNLRFVGDQDYNGPASITITVNDNGNTGNGTARSDVQTLNFNISPVNDAPVLTLPGSAVLASEDIQTNISGIRVDDVDAGDGILSVELVVGNGVISLGSLTGLTNVSGNNTRLLTFEGTLATINNALQTLRYLGDPSFNGTDNLQIAVSDNGNTGAGFARTTTGTVAINIVGLNSPPAINLPSGIPETAPNTNLSIPTIFITDPDVGDGLMEISLRVGNGRLTVNPAAGITFLQGTSEQGNRITFEGTIGAINGTLATLVYRGNPGFIDAFDTLEISVSDRGNTGVGTALSDFDTLRIRVGDAVNQPPVVGVDNFNASRNGTLTVAAPGVRANDFDPNGDPLTLSLSTNAANGTVSNFNTNGSFTYVPNPGFIGTDSFVYAASDGIDTVAGTVFINVTNNAPVATNDTYTFTVSTPQTIPVNLGVLANDSDPNNDPLVASLVDSVGASGSLALNPNGSFVYTPPSTAFSGVETFTYKVNDGLVDSNVATILITVSTTTVPPINQPPVANNNNYSTPADTPLTITLRAEGVLANDTDPDTPLEQLTATTTQTVTPNGGSLTLNPDGTFAYTPATGFSGIDSFTYFANDGALNSLNPATVFITVGTATNQPPVANDNSFRALPSTAVQPFTLTVGSDRSILLNDSDPDNDPLTATIITPPAGTLANFDSATGTFTYVPVVNFTGVDSFVYQLSDGSGGTATATVLITVAANTPPAVQDLLYTVVAGGTLSVDSNGGINPTDAEGDLITLELVNQPTQGTVTLNPDGSFIYTPTTGTIGAVDSFTYLARDEFDASPVATVTLTFVGNSPPQAVDDTYSIAFNRTLSAVDAINRVTGNDFDPDPGTTFTTNLITDVTSGTLTFNSDGTFIYNPAAGTAATVGQVVTFVYELSDNFGATDTATVSITVTDSTILVANDDNYTVSSGQTLSPSPASQNGLLDNDALVPGTTATITVLTQPTLGQLTVPPAADGSFTYVPNQGATGVDSFTYQFGDGTETSGIGTAFITISTNQAPVAVGETFTAVGDRPFTVTAPGVLANDSDPDNDPLSVNIPLEFEGNNGPGFLDLATDGSFVYRPPVGGFVGTATFVYAVSDGSTNALATLTLNLTANAAPIAQPTVFTVNRGNTLTPVVGVLDPTFVSDPDGDVLTATLTAPTTRGTLTDFNPTTGTFTYVPDGAQFPTAGTDSFVYQISDGSNVITQTATISVVITSAPPVADNDSFSGDANNPLTIGAIGVLEGDTDPDGDVLAVANPGTLTTANSGVVTLNADGSFIYQPAANFVGTDSFTYQATDGINLSNLATVEITVGATNNPPQLQVPGAQISLNRAPVVIPPIVVSDRDAGNNPIRVSLRGFQVQVLPNPPQPVGTLSLASLDGLTIVNGANNSGAITIEGTITALNAALATLTYTPPASGQPGDTLTELPILVSVNDLGFTGGTGTPQTQVTSVPIVVSTGESLITDINRFPNATNGTLGASPQNLTPVGNLIYFTADDGFNGVELWRSDGTAGGTILVADINPLLDGAASSEPRNLTVVGNTLYFTANDGTNGRELWRLNLASPGAEPALVTDINPAGSSNPSNLVALPSGTLFFQATNAQGNRLVYRLDGDTAVAVGSGYVNPTQLTLVGDTLYFVANNETELWRSDGTTAGTVRVQTIAPGASVQNLVAIGNILYFVATDAANGRELWRSDGTAAGTTRISNINPGTGNADPNNLVNLNGVLYFFANNGTTNGLYRTTPAGGVELVPGTALPSGGAAPRSLTVVGNTLFFVVDAGTPANPNEQLWAATTTGITGQVRDINPFGSDNLQSLTNVNGKLFFVANDSQNTRIWQSDGTTAGTTPLTTNAFNTGPVPANITAAGNRIFFTAAGFTEEDPTIDLGVELWRLL